MLRSARNAVSQLKRLNKDLTKASKTGAVSVRSGTSLSRLISNATRAISRACLRNPRTLAKDKSLADAAIRKVQKALL